MVIAYGGIMKSNINLLLDSICKNGIDTDSEQQIRNSISKVLGRLNDAVRGAETDDELMSSRT